MAVSDRDAVERDLPPLMLLSISSDPFSLFLCELTQRNLFLNGN